MSMCERIRIFWREQRASAGAEFAILSIVFFGIMFGIIDFGMVMFEYNRAEKACRRGVRYAVMNDIVAREIADWDNEAASCKGGDPIPANAISPNPVVCDSSSCSGGYTHNDNAYQGIVNEMGSIYGRVLTDPSVNVQVTYENIGMGFCGNPSGPDIWPLTTVTLSGPTYNFITPLLGGLTTVEFKCESTLTGEDFNTCENGTGAPWC